MAGPARAEHIIADIDTRLRTQHGLDLGLAGIGESAAALRPQQALAFARHLLAERAVDMQAVTAELTAAVQRIRESERVLPFSELGWPERRDELTTACRTDPAAGLAEWLDDWFTAVAWARFDACERLVDMADALPPGTAALVRRLHAATLALASSDWHVAAEALRAGARGLTMTATTVPSNATREGVWVVLIRFALALGRAKEAGRELGEAQEEFASSIFAVLAERLRLADPTDDAARSDLASLGGRAPDALLEVARMTSATTDASSSDMRVDAGLTAARRAVAAAVSLDEANQQVRRMFGPVPAEIYLALAERAHDEGDSELEKASLLTAVSVVDRDAVRGEVQDRLADIARRDGDSDAERRARLDAANAWSRTLRDDRTIADAQRLLALAHDDVEARCMLASSLLQVWWRSPGEAALTHLQRALETIEPVGAMVTTGDRYADPDWFRSWALWLQSYGYSALADFDVAHAVDLKWRAMRAACRSVALQPANESMWNCLADAAYELELWSLAEIAAREALRISDVRTNVDEYVRALMNLGDFETALATIDEPQNEFEWNMHAQALVILGRYEEALAAFALHPPNPQASWAREGEITTLLITGRRQEALTAAKNLNAWLQSRGGKSTLPAAARVKLILGEDEKVESIVGELQASGDSSGNFSLAVVRLAQGRPTDAHLLLTSYVRSFETMNDVRAWPTIDVELINVIARNRGIAPPDLTQHNREVGEVETVLISRRDPVVEIADAAADCPPFADVQRLAPLVIAMARRDVSAVETHLAGMDAHSAGGSLDGLRAWVREVSSPGVDETQSPPPRAAESETPAEPEPYLVRLELPPSWFAEYSDPLSEHPLFLEYLPALRLTSEAPIPAVKVRTDSDLEPSDYRVYVREEEVERGTLPDGRWLLAPAAQRLVPSGVVQEPWNGGLPDLAGVTVAAPAEDDHSCIRLLALSPCELALRRLEAAVASHADDLAPSSQDNAGRGRT